MSDLKGESCLERDAATETGSYVRYLEQELEQARRLEEIALLAGVVAHDLNNMLTPIFGYSTILKRDMEQDHPLAKAVSVIEKSAERAAQLIGKLLGCSRQQDSIRMPFDIVRMLDTYLDSLKGWGGVIEKDYAAVPAVLGDPHHVAVVIRAIAGNSLEAMGDNGRLFIAVESVTLDATFSRQHPPVKPGPHVCVTVQDNGRGIPAEVIGRVFEPFFSTKPDAACAGTGLTVAHSLMRRNSGCIELESVEGQGTTVRVYLPEAQSEH